MSVLEDIEAFCQGVDEPVYLARINPGRVLKHSRRDELAALDNWACAIGEGVRYSFGKDADEAWNLAKTEFDARALS